jgi:hypothetical protein
MTDQTPNNFIVVIHGRGVLHTCIAKGTLEEVTEKAEACLLSGFEVHVYALKLDPTVSHLTYLPTGVDLLQRVFHMWDAKDEVSELVSNIMIHMDEHTEGMAKRYVQQAIDELTEQLQTLNAGSETQVHEPSFDQPESTTTGS